MSEPPEIPPLDDATRALLDRVRSRRTEPPAAPADARVRVRAGVHASIGLARKGTNDAPLGAGLGRARFLPFFFAAAASLLLAIGFGVSARRGALPKQDERVAISASPCGGGASVDDDPHNCGRCGHDCCGGTCERGTCQPYVVAQGYHPGVAAVGGAYVYWPDGSDSLGRIMRAPKRGDGEPSVVASNQRRPWAVAVDDSFAYWVTNIGEAPDYGGVFKAPLGGGDVIPLVASGEPFAGDIAVTSTGLYWDDYGAYPSQGRNLLDCAPGAAIRRSNLDGSGVATLAGPDGGVCTPLLFAVHEDEVFWASRSRGSVDRVQIDGGGFAHVAAASDPMSVAVGESDVFWVSWQDGLVGRSPLAGGASVIVASSGHEAGANGGVGGVDVVVDDSYVYWARQGPPWGSGGAILIAPISQSTGEEGAVLATSPGPVNLTLDQACLYWADGSDGKIRGVAKP